LLFIKLSLNSKLKVSSLFKTVFRSNDKGKLLERVGRKVMSLKSPFGDMVVRLPNLVKGQSSTDLLKPYLQGSLIAVDRVFYF